MRALAWVFQEAKAILEARGQTRPADLDYVAHRILRLASEGIAPAYILSEVLRDKRSVFEIPVEQIWEAKISTGA